LQAIVLGWDRSPVELFIEMHVWSDDHQKGMQPSSALYGMLVFNLFFLKLLFPWIDEFIFSFQDTYDNLLKKRYGDNPSTYPDLDSDLLLETWSSGGFDRNWVYIILNTTTKNLRTTRGASIVGCSQSISSIQTP
jgi:hypothetical protein